MPDGMWSMVWGMCGSWGFGMLFTVFSWIVVLLGLALVVGWVLRLSRPGTRHSAVESLRERYARGAISREEFDARAARPLRSRRS